MLLAHFIEENEYKLCVHPRLLYPQETAVEVKEVTLSVHDDFDGSSAALRGWLASAGPDAGWELLSPGPSTGQGIADQIGLVLDSSVALLELYDRVRSWISQRKQDDAKPVTAVTVVEIKGKLYEMVVTLNPLNDEVREGRGGRAS
jgi:hypothetical protein